VLRSPNDWPAAQRDFHQLYGLDVWADFARTPVLWQVGQMSSEDPRIGYFPVASADQRVAFQMTFWRLEAPAGSPCLLMFDGFPVPKADLGTGVLIGEVGVNAVCCLESDDPTDPVVWPTYNPTMPVRRHPKPDTSDA
jgi:hypothetical protein